MIQRQRVLIIDVNRRMVDRLQESFIQSGYEAEIALSSSVGLAIINERHMSVAILSAKMGSDEDWQIVKRLKKTDPRLPVVLFDAPEGKDLSKEAKRAGVERFLVRPVDVETVRQEAIKVMRN